MRGILIVAVFFLLHSCEKESFFTDPGAQLYISADTIKFDTVFTSTGSITQSFKIRNDNDGKLLLSEVKLMGETNSPFRINVNGTAANSVNDIEIAKGDSIYVFVTVTIDPNTDSLPFIVSDSIRISFNGNQRFVQLEAFGQNAHFIRDGVISGQQIWNNDLPYVILGGIRIDSSASLQINAGCRIYFHADAPMDVFGSLQVSGTATARVLFTGDRLDSYYRDLPGSWPGIYLRENSNNNSIRFAVIKNAYQALVCFGRASSPAKLHLSQSIIDNAYETGLAAVNSNIRCDNTLISNCGRNLVILQGGNYALTHTTISSFSTEYLPHRYPVAYVSDEGSVNGTTVNAPLQLDLVNCIIWGESGFVASEFQTIKKGNSFTVSLDHCLLRAQDDPANTNFVSVIRNMDPMFDSIDAGNNYFDFHTNNRPGAPGVNSGTTTLFQFDLDDLNRNVATPDMGCYEKQ